jgi:mannose-6-phosphate isomerase
VASETGEELYATPIDEFRLSRYVLTGAGASVELPDATPQIVLCTAGTVTVGSTLLKPGESAFVPAGETAELAGTGTAFRATVVI